MEQKINPADDVLILPQLCDREFKHDVIEVVAKYIRLHSYERQKWLR